MAIETMYKLISIAFMISCIFCDDDEPSVTLESIEYNATTISTTTEELNLDWLPEAVKDISYYLRQHKFNEYDRRYQKTPTNNSYYSLFPKPPLRSLHWEVQLHCQVSFVHCMEYLNKKVKLTGLRRKDDTSFVVVEQNWTQANQEQINTIEEECQSKKKLDEVLANPFQGPIERFKWRTSASYYLCWYTMNEVPTLEYLGEPCDNFASCLDPKMGAQNRDVRADDTQRFGCALYSFCPDPCCPAKHISSFEECYDNDLNPCKDYANRTCTAPHVNNTSLTSLILNHLNVSCRCPVGYSWRSRYAQCVDVNECAVGSHTCTAGELCVNQPGAFVCVCGWGYTWNDVYDKCDESKAVRGVKKGGDDRKKKRFRFSFRGLFGKGCRWECSYYLVVVMVIVTVLIK